MFSHTAQYYDTIYLAMKDYGAEADTLTAIIHQYRRSIGNRLLDVACGTGLHLSYLKHQFEVEGLDLDEQLLAIARQRNPAIPLHHANMTDFNLGRTFDVVTCLFSAIGYVKTLENLSRAVQCMAQHLPAGGVLLIEPWFTPETWRPGTVHARFIDEPDLRWRGSIPASLMDGCPLWTCITSLAHQKGPSTMLNVMNWGSLPPRRCATP